MTETSREIVSLNVDNFGERTKSAEVVVLHLTAEWCGPCQAFRSVFQETAESHDDIVFGVVDTDSQPELGAAFQVKSIPTIVVMRAGAVVFMHEGSLSEKALNDVIRQAREIDVDAVRKSIQSSVPST